MEDEAEFKDPKTGNTTMLPVRVGLNLGYEQVVETPAELLPSDDEAATPADLAYAEMEHAASVVYGVASNGVDNLTKKEVGMLSFLAASLFRLGFTSLVLEGDTSEAKQGEPLSVKELVDLIEAKITSPDDFTDEEDDQFDRLADMLLTAEQSEQRDGGKSDPSTDGAPKTDATKPAGKPKAEPKATKPKAAPAATPTTPAVPVTGTTAPTGQVSDSSTPVDNESAKPANTNEGTK